MGHHVEFKRPIDFLFRKVSRSYGLSTHTSCIKNVTCTSGKVERKGGKAKDNISTNASMVIVCSVYRNQA